MFSLLFIKCNVFISKLIKSTMSIFTQKLNPITGTSDWIVQEENYDYHQEVARSAFADMLHDTERNQLYEQALKIAIGKLHKMGKKAHVLDIGTGTGLLSMMAVRNGADSVTACEAFRPMGDCALKIIKLNGFEDKIQVKHKRSTDLMVGENGDLKMKCNILVTEVFDTELIGEGALSTFTHAHQNLLEKDAIVIPDSATMYAQVVECPIAHNWNKLKDFYDNDGELLLQIPKNIKSCTGSAAVHDIQLSQLATEYINTIVPCTEVFNFDWSGKKKLEFKRTSVVITKAERDGKAQAVFMWWSLKMDQEGEIILSCAPKWAHPLCKEIDNGVKIPWRDHWMQAVYYLPQEIDVKSGEEITILSSHDEYSLWFNLQKNHKPPDDLVQPICHCSLHVLFSRTRIGQLNDFKRYKLYLSIFEKYVNNQSKVLILSESFYTSLICSKLGAKHVIIIETNETSRKLMLDFIQYNDLPNNLVVLEDFKKLKGLIEENSINIVLSEPYFLTSILPWDNLSIIYKLKQVRTYLSENVKIFPKCCRIKALAMHFFDLHKIRRPLGKCEGFIMSDFDKLIEESINISDDSVEAQPLWEYPGIALSDVIDILSLDISNNAEFPIEEIKGQIILKWNKQPCNGIAFWVDWVHEDGLNGTISTGPTTSPIIGETVLWYMHARQGVSLFPEDRPNSINYLFKFDLNDGNISFKCT